MQTMFPTEGLAQIIRSPDGHDWHRQETDSYDSNAKQKACGFAGERLKRVHHARHGDEFPGPQPHQGSGVCRNRARGSPRHCSC